MAILVDTNILLRIAETASSSHAEVVQATRLLGVSHSLVTVPQIAYEYWAVATRTIAANGLGMTVKEADRSLHEMLDIFPVLRDERGILRQWRRLVRDYEVEGLKSHDTRIVAAMKRHHLDQLLTLNAGDFNRYQEITVLTPKLVLAKN